MSVQLRITKPALSDIKNIADYLAEQSGLARSDRFLAELNDRLTKISEFPNIGRKRDEVFPNSRSLAVGSYLIFYVPTESETVILRVASGYRDLSALFDD